MKARPILMSAPMVIASLREARQPGTGKTQTRRIVKLPRESGLGVWEASTTGGPGVTDSKGRPVPEHPVIWHTRSGTTIGCPYGIPGDLLYVRETCLADERESDMLDGVLYYADNAFIPIQDSQEAADRWLDMHYYRADSAGVASGAPVPGIHMPRWASRLTLRITEVRVERLQEIREADAIAEGVFAGAVYPPESFTDRQVLDWKPPEATASALDAFRSLWESINGDGSWAANPWVWALTFEVFFENVDSYIERTDYALAA